MAAKARSSPPSNCRCSWSNWASRTPGPKSGAAQAGDAGVAAGSTPPSKPPHKESRKKERKGHGRRPLPSSLPREQRVHQPPPEALRCEACGRDKTCCGQEKSETLEWVPGHFKVIEEVRPKYACRPCGDGLVVAPPADRVIEGGLPGPGLVAHVLVSKFKDHLPLHRLSGIYARHGVQLRTSTLSDWVAAGADTLQPLAREVAQRALASHVLQSDDTHLKVLDREHPNGLKRGHMWVYLGDTTWAAFVYTPDWKEEGPLSFLDKREGWLLVDGYKGYDKLFTRQGATAVEVGAGAMPVATSSRPWTPVTHERRCRSLSSAGSSRWSAKPTSSRWRRPSGCAGVTRSHALSRSNWGAGWPKSTTGSRRRVRWHGRAATPSTSGSR
ncbi:IS66 family transposase [Archangium minus]|uniref:IS66 family transposase n=1 Tax=Archangium minus TaxID=83450 RepID=A0ABY9X3W5_9BACT|nr:IS66 family transposase [Archangium minus]